MDMQQTIRLLGEISLIDDRAVRTDETEQLAQVRMWAAILRAVPYEFAGEAVGAHYAESAYPVLPKDIAARWRVEARSRMARHTDTFEPTAHPDVDPDDVTGFQAALRDDRAAVVRGVEAPAPVLALLSGIGRRVGDEPGEIVSAPAGEEYLAAKARVVAVERPADPPARAVRCTACGADAGKPCKTVNGSRTLAGVHGSREDAYASARERGAL